ncbi:MAG: hypothetical protein ACKOJI_04160 [Phycisphaerales bacterium]
MARRRQTTPAPGSAAADPALRRVQKLCEQRAFRERDVGIAREVSAIARQARQDAERRGEFADAWVAAMPADLVAETWLESATPVAMVIGVASAPLGFAVDRALRAGALAKLRLQLRAPGLRVRTRIGPPPA